MSSLFDVEEPTPSLAVALFGSDPAERLLAVEPQEEGVILYWRDAQGKVQSERASFEPWLLVDEKMDHLEARWEPLEAPGEGRFYRWKARFQNWQAWDISRRLLRDQHADLIAYRSPARQYLIETGRALFRGMTFNDIHRLQVDIETVDLDPHPEQNAVLMIAMSDNRGYSDALTGEEPELLKAFVERVRELDPDIIEGHNLYEFDLRFLAARAKRHGVPLNLGRDGSEMTFGSPRNCPIGANSRPFTPASIHGRHLLDTYLAVQRYDVARGELESYGLKESAQSLGIAPPDRVYLERERISDLITQDPERVRTYALQDVEETRRLAEITLPTEFYQTQLIPDSLQNLATTGTGEKVNLFFIRAYLQAGKAIPKQQPSQEYAGGYTEVRRVGLIERVVKADVESLYPSLMLTFHLKPATDHLNVFLPALRELTQRRLDAKARMKQASGLEAAYWDGLQGSFKILINSFYGYLGAPFNFNDYEAAQKVTEYGRDIVQQIADKVEALGGSVIEIDTDGVFFQPPPDIKGEEQEEAFVQQAGEELPEGIRLAFDGRYQAILSLKIKNYVLLGYDGKKVFKGASLRSRADEPFGRKFLSMAVDWLLKGEPQAVSDEYHRLWKAIREGSVPIAQLCRRERVTEKSVRPGHRLYDLAKEFKVGDYINVYQKRDGRLGLLEAYENDEDRDHYADKLYKFVCRLEDLFNDFDALFPNPHLHDPDQMTLF